MQNPKSANHIEILILDNDVLIRAGIRKLLEHQSHLDMHIKEGLIEEGARLASTFQPDIILLRDAEGGSPIFELLPGLVNVLQQPRIILISCTKESDFIVKLVNGGVMGVVYATQAPEVLFKAIEKVHAGEIWLDRTMVANVITKNIRILNKVDPKARKKASLSRRELDVIVLVGEGMKNQQIADRLYLSEVTVRHHLTSIFKKLGVADRLELVIYAYQNGLATLPN